MARSALVRRDELGGVPLLYEESGRQQVFAMEAGFLARMEAWLSWWVEHSGEPAPDELVSFGTWIDGSGSCSSWHHAGRAFDLTALRRDGQVQHWARIDRVEALPPSEQPAARRRYWQLSAGLALHFADVLTHLFDDAHRNHVHVDNGQSGDGMSRFTGRSRIQVLTVQAVCAEVWGLPGELSGRWDRGTRERVEEVLGRVGASGDLVEDQAAWETFCTASVEQPG